MNAAAKRARGGRRGRAVAGLALVGASLELLAVTPAAAEDPFGERTVSTPADARLPDDVLEGSGGEGDGVYGRLDGDSSLSVVAGVETDLDAPAARLLGALEYRYFSTVGLYAAYRESLDAADAEERLLSAGILIEPLFLARWSQAAASGHAFWDLSLDSVSLSAGAFWAQPRDGGFGEDKGLELGLGVGVPLLARAPGPWLRVRGLARLNQRADVSPALWVTLEWRGLFETPLRGAMGRRGE